MQEPVSLRRPTLHPSREFTKQDTASRSQSALDVTKLVLPDSRVGYFDTLADTHS